MKIALDIMGFENPTKEAILAAKKFCHDYQDTQVILVGDKNLIKSKLCNNMSIIHTNNFISMNDSPIQGLRKLNTSMQIAMQLTKDKKVDGFVSAGNTSCFTPLIKLTLDPINSNNSFGFMTYIPTANGKGFNLVDTGANIHVSAQNLFDFALMANQYVKTVRKINNPKIGILNIGSESHKGYDYHIEANSLLKKTNKINYVGFVEPKQLLLGIVDVCVCDGFSGNICLKAFEGAFKTMSILLKKGYAKPWNWIGAIGSLPMLKHIISKFNYKNYAGAIVLGVNGVAIKTHGSADRKQFYSALKIANQCISNNLLYNMQRINYGK